VSKGWGGAVPATPTTHKTLVNFFQVDVEFQFSGCFCLNSVWHSVARWYVYRYSYQKFKFVQILEWKMLNYFIVILLYFKAIWDILWPFGIYCSHLVYFSGFGIMYQDKSGNPGLASSIADLNWFKLGSYIPMLITSAYRQQNIG
jgi:hypothetical protein